MAIRRIGNQVLISFIQVQPLAREANDSAPFKLRVPGSADFQSIGISNNLRRPHEFYRAHFALPLPATQEWGEDRGGQPILTLLLGRKAHALPGPLLHRMEEREVCLVAAPARCAGSPTFNRQACEALGPE